MRKILPIAVAALAFAPEAGAKVCASVRVVPAHPVVGQSVHVRLTTWMPRWVGSRAYFARHEGLPTSRPLRVQLAPPHAAPFTIAPGPKLELAGDLQVRACRQLEAST
jgi:hypothetical protein